MVPVFRPFSLEGLVLFVKYIFIATTYLHYHVVSLLLPGFLFPFPSGGEERREGCIS
jgi:hypothetical protein